MLHRRFEGHARQVAVAHQLGERLEREIRVHDAGALNRAAVGFLITAVLVLGLGRVQILLVSRIGESFLKDLRVRVFDHIQAMSMGFFDREPTGRLVARMTSDVDSLQEMVQLGLIAFVSNTLLPLAILLSIGVACEWPIRRRAARNSQKMKNER